MQIRQSKTRCFWAVIVLLVPTLIWVLSYPSQAGANPYSNSAHGNTDPEPGYGVKRASVDHPTGDCAHCHDTFDPFSCSANNFMLFYDDWIGKGDLFCFECHSASTEHQQVTNYPYCVNFGGRAAFYGNIKKQFTNQYSKPANCGSRHDLEAIRDLMIDDIDGWGFSSDPDPCVACHPPHAAQRNHPVAIDGQGKLNSAIRRPVHYKSSVPGEILWGDDNDERMDGYASGFDGGLYQAPYYASFGSGEFEPAGDATSDGTNLPDYVTFCLDCHQYEQYDPERNETVKAIDWSDTGDRHGGYPGNTCDAGDFYGGDPFESALRPPYDTYEPNQSNFVMSCLDCHEPHGTKKRLHLIRRMINGEGVAADNDPCDQPTDWVSICARCHYLTHSAPDCTGCHYHGIQCWHPAVCAGNPCF